jgi:hypothetical protein
MNQDETRKALQELVNLAINAKELKIQMKNLKNDIVDKVQEGKYHLNGGDVQIKRELKTKIADLQQQLVIDPKILPAEDVKNFLKSSLSLNKTGKQSLIEGDDNLNKIVEKEYAIQFGIKVDPAFLKVKDNNNLEEDEESEDEDEDEDYKEFDPNND